MPTQTEAIVVPAQKSAFQFSPIELEDPLEDEVIVKIVACGICHTDIAIQQGDFPSPYPCIPGHEGAGIVQSTGKSVTTVKKGDKVLLSYTSCGACSACQDHRPSMCPSWQAMNFGRLRSVTVGDRPGAVMVPGKETVHGAFFGQSSMARMALVSEASCVKVPDDTDLETLAPLGCGLMTGAGAVFNRLKPSPSSSIAIYGLGAVGMSGILAAAHLGVSTIIAIDLVPSRLETALSFGATHTLNASDPDIVSKVRALTRDHVGTEFTLEASGNMRAFRNAYEATAPGGHMTSAGTPGPGVKPAFDVFEHVCSAKIYSAVLMGCCYPREFIPFLIDLHRQGKFPIEKISKKYKVEQFQEAIHAMESGEVIKPIIVFD